MLVFALILVFVLSTISNMLLNPPPVVEVTKCELTSDTVNSGEQTSISITMKSNDNENAHLIRIEFSSHHLVRFLLGAGELPRDGNLWYYQETLNPRADHTQLINVRPTLEPGISKLSYRISIVFLIDNEQFHSKNLDLTVQLA